MKENYWDERREACKNINLNNKYSPEKRLLLSQLATLRNKNL